MGRSHRATRRVVACISVASLCFACAVFASSPSVAQNTTRRFSFGCTHSVKGFTVPQGSWARARIEVAGAEGNTAHGSDSGRPGGGGAVSATVSVQPGDVMFVAVGCRTGWGDGSYGQGGAGGIATGDGLHDGGHGGGASRVTGAGWMLIAGGGGGPGSEGGAQKTTGGAGGPGGNPAGNGGRGCCTSLPGGQGGAAHTGMGQPGEDALGNFSGAGGGGGGGCNGGGGGGGAPEDSESGGAGGGGGSSCTRGSGMTDVEFGAKPHEGNGSVTITLYVAPAAPAPTTSSRSSTTTMPPTTSTTAPSPPTSTSSTTTSGTTSTTTTSSTTTSTRPPSTALTPLTVHLRSPLIGGALVTIQRHAVVETIG
jgi:hypothetical protein